MLKGNSRNMPSYKITERDSEIITYLKGIAIFLVVFDHCFSYYSRIYELTVGLNTLLVMVRYVHMPLFFVISGFLCHKQNVLDFYKKKLTRVLVPFVFFSILKLVFSNLVANEFVHRDSLSGQLYDSFILGEGYWFAYAICLIYLVAPFFWNDQNTSKEGTPPWRAIIGVVFIVIFNALYYGMNWHFLKIIFQFRNAVLYLPYFLCGYIIRFYFSALKKWYSKKKWLVLPLSALIITAVTFLEVMNIRINSFTTKFIVSFPLMLFILLFCSILPNKIMILLNAGKYSWQVMLLDALYKAILFALLSKFLSIKPLYVCIITVIDYMFGILTSLICRRIPVLKSCMGL